MDDTMDGMTKKKQKWQNKRRKRKRRKQEEGEEEEGEERTPPSPLCTPDLYNHRLSIMMLFRFNSVGFGS